MFIPTNQVFIPTNSNNYYNNSAYSDIIISPLSSPTYSPVYSYNTPSDFIYSPTSSPTFNFNTGLNKDNDYIYSPGPNAVVSTSSLFLNPYSPVATTVNYTYNKPNFSLFQGLNSDSYTIEKITKYFHDLALDNWLFEDLSDILNYFVISNGEVDLIKSFNDYKADNSKNYSKSDKKKIIEFIEKYFLTLSVTQRALQKYVKESGAQWVHLPHSKYFVRQLIGEKIMKLIRTALSKK